MAQVLSNANGLYLLYIHPKEALTPEEYWQNRLDSLNDIWFAAESGNYTHPKSNALNRLKESIIHDYRSALKILKGLRTNKK